jgi:hypothetical protein
VYVDALLTIMIAQQQKDNHINVPRAVIEAISKTKNLFLLKFWYEITGFLWSFIPIFGWFRAFRHRTYWAMASNVIAYENLPMNLAIQRCPQLMDLIPTGRGFQTLITIPSIIESLLLIILSIGITILDNSIFFALAVIGFFWTLLPWSAAVNTILYFSLPQDKVKESLKELTNLRLYENYCPECRFYHGDQGICDLLQINIAEYPSQFQKRCNAHYYQAP